MTPDAVTSTRAQKSAAWRHRNTGYVRSASAPGNIRAPVNVAAPTESCWPAQAPTATRMPSPAMTAASSGPSPGSQQGEPTGDQGRDGQDGRETSGASVIQEP
jgi:hypothetical protein